MDHTVGLDAMDTRKISRHYAESSPGSSSPYPTHYTDYANPTPRAADNVIT